MGPTERQALKAHMVRLRDGDRAAFSPVYEVLWPIVRRFAERSVGAENGEDVAQQALIKLFEQAARYDESHDVVPWALTITAWECRTAIKKISRRREAPLPVGEDIAMSTSEDEPFRRLLLEEAEQVLSLLTDRDRETLAMAFSDQGSGPTFRKRKQRAVSRLRAAWRAIHG